MVKIELFDFISKTGIKTERKIRICYLKKLLFRKVSDFLYNHDKFQNYL